MRCPLPDSVERLATALSRGYRIERELGQGVATTNALAGRRGLKREFGAAPPPARSDRLHP